MFKKTILSAFALAALVAAQAQDSTKKASTTISGSVDAYYRYDFNNQATNNKTSFTNSANSFELGMATLKVDHSIGKVSATADLGFGRRAAEFSYNDAGSLASVKQLYVSYAATEKLKFTFGKFATHIGYELSDGVANRNYSMSYGFSYGPFTHTGLKADISLGGKTAFMVGVANVTDVVANYNTATYNVGIAQLSTATKNDKLKAYLNFQGGKDLSQVDLVLMGVISSKFALNYDGTIQNQAGKVWTSNAVYANYDPTSKFGLTLRVENFDNNKKVGFVDYWVNDTQTNIFATTLSANIKVDALTIIPEFRLDSSSDNVFSKSNGASTKSAGSFILAVAYKF